MKYRIKNIITNDWPALSSSIGIPIIWVINFIFPYISKSNQSITLLLPMFVTCLLLILLMWRILRIAWFFKNGLSSTGKVTFLKIVKDRGRIEFCFTNDGSSITAWSPIHKTKKALSLVPDTNIEVLFDKENPTRAIIKELYIS